MQFISVHTALAAFKVAGAAALPSAVIGASDLVTRDGSILGSKVCVDVNFGGYCQTINTQPAGARGCVRLDDSIRGLVSSVQPLEKSECRYYDTENCQERIWGCGESIAWGSQPIPDLKTSAPAGILYSWWPDLKCENENMDKRIRSFACYPYHDRF